MKSLLIIILVLGTYASNAQVSPVYTRDTLILNATAAPAGVTKATLSVNVAAASPGGTKANLSYDPMPVVFIFFFPFKLN